MPAASPASSLPAGFFVLDKPPGVTSFAMVGLIRRLTGIRKVGHAGTLDPMATGVLPIAIGAATRLIDLLHERPKTYLATITLGVTTDSGDADGAELDRQPVTCDEPSLEAVLPRFVGLIQQSPPAYSALKISGVPAYARARRGEVVDLAPRPVTIESIELVAFDTPLVQLRVRCQKGTYIRSLAADIGAALGCGAHLSALVRESAGGFDFHQASTPADLVSLERDQLAARLVSVQAALPWLDRIAISADEELELRQGRTIAATGDPAQSTQAIAIALDGEAVSLLRRQESLWAPWKVFASQPRT